MGARYPSLQQVSQLSLSLYTYFKKPWRSEICGGRGIGQKYWGALLENVLCNSVRPIVTFALIVKVCSNIAFLLSQVATRKSIQPVELKNFTPRSAWRTTASTRGTRQPSSPASVRWTSGFSRLTTKFASYSLAPGRTTAVRLIWRSISTRQE